MLDPYRMVAVNLVAFSALVAGILVYKFIYPKKDPNLFFLLLLFSLLPLISIFRSGVYESGDMTQNIYKSMSFYKNLSEGNLLPQWAGELNNTYGYPLFIYIYPLPFYLISIFHFLGFSFVLSIKLLITTSFIVSGIGMYLWVKEELGKFPGLVGAIFFLYAPYHLVDMHYRVSLGEILSFAIIPFVLLFTKRTIKKIKKENFLLLTALLSLFLLANQAIALFGFVLTAAYGLFTWRQYNAGKTKVLIYFTSSFIVALLLTAFYWLPVILESGLTHQALYVKTIEYVHLSNLIFSSWRHGLLFQGPQGELSFIIGYVQIFVVITSLLYLIRGSYRRHEKTKNSLHLVLIGLLCLLMLPVSSLIWDKLDILRNFQFTYRLLLFVSLSTAFLAALISTKLKKHIVIILCLLAIAQTTLNWGNRGTIPDIDDEYLHKALPQSTFAGEGFQPAAPKWVDPNNPWQKTMPNSNMELLSGDAEIKELKRTTTRHEYVVIVRERSYLKENTIYYPNWTVFANNQEVPINYENPLYPGVITFKLDKDIYYIETVFEDTYIRRISRIISALTLGALFIFITSNKSYYNYLSKRILSKYKQL